MRDFEFMLGQMLKHFVYSFVVLYSFKALKTI
jgi:hypothetical protein